MNQAETIKIRSEFVNVVLTEALVEAAESMQLRKETLRQAHPEAKALLREYDQREAVIADLLKQLAAL